MLLMEIVVCVRWMPWQYGCGVITDKLGTVPRFGDCRSAADIFVETRRALVLDQVNTFVSTLDT